MRCPGVLPAQGKADTQDLQGITQLRRVARERTAQHLVSQALSEALQALLQFWRKHKGTTHNRMPALDAAAEKHLKGSNTRMPALDAAARSHLEGCDALPESGQLVLGLGLPEASCQEGFDVQHRLPPGQAQDHGVAEVEL